jgi:sulfite reductase alpha subunit-like flavoprotein
VVLIAISTTGQGDLPPNSQKFWKAIRSARLRPGCLQQMRFTSFGLGDTSYPKYNWAHRKLYNRLVQLGAQPICDRGESDEQHPEGYVNEFVTSARCFCILLTRCLMSSVKLGIQRNSKHHINYQRMSDHSKASTDRSYHGQRNFANISLTLTLSLMASSRYRMMFY